MKLAVMVRIWTELVDAAFVLHPAEPLDEIRCLFRKGIVDPWPRTPEGFEREATCDREISLKRHAGAFRGVRVATVSSSTGRFPCSQKPWRDRFWFGRSSR
jgi:hypothetical protein